MQGNSSRFPRPLNATLFILAPPHLTVRSPVCHLPLPVSQLLNLSSSALQPKDQKKKKADLVNSAAECQGARRVGGGSVTPRAHSPGARRPPLPSVPPSPASPGSERRPSPGEIRGCSRLPSPPPHPRQALQPGLQSRLSSGLHFYCLSIPGFLLPLWKGVPGPQAWHLPFHREGKMDIWGPRSPAPPAAATSRPLLTVTPTFLETFRFLLKL